jgi:GNAT superfamily N-acetyltransferase
MIHIRPYSPNDYTFVISLAPRLTIGMPSYRDAQLKLKAVQEWIEESLKNHNQASMVFIAENSKNQPLGFATVSQTTHFTGEAQAYIGEIATTEQAEGQGIGKALLNACEAWGRAKGYRLLSLTTGAANQKALGFYHHLGYHDEDIALVKLLTDTKETQ